VTEYQGHQVPTTGGLLLFGRDRLRHFPDAWIQVGRFRGTQAGYDRPDAWIYIGQAYVGARKYKDALPPLEKAVAIAPESDQAYALMGWAYFGLKDAANFKKAAGKARTLGHKEPTLLQYLTRVEGGEPIK
jgi:tetratricopeptide (TPR) repeat protein